MFVVRAAKEPYTAAYKAQALVPVKIEGPSGTFACRRSNSSFLESDSAVLSRNQLQHKTRTLHCATQTFFLNLDCFRLANREMEFANADAEQ